MALTLDSRHIERVWILRCQGRIVAGEENSQLAAAVDRAAQEFSRLVINVSEVAKVDSTGMGLLVRLLTHARRRGGDLRLAQPGTFFRELLALTGLDRVFRAYDSEDEAILSFLEEPPAAESPVKGGPVVLFLDHSADLGVFARTILGTRGYEVISTTLVSDARLLLTASRVDFIVLGPDSSRLPHNSVMDSLQSRAPGAKLLVLPAGFRNQDADAAGVALINLLEQGT